MSKAHFTSKAEMLRLIEQRIHDKSHALPLLTANYHDQLSLVCAGRGGATVPLSALDRARMPAVVLVGDDVADGFDPGPCGWPSAKRLMRWARVAVVHASGGDRQRYQQFVQLALLHRKLLVIETGTARAGAWLDLCRAAKLPTVLVKPLNDGIQPAPSCPGTRH